MHDLILTVSIIIYTIPVSCKMKKMDWVVFNQRLSLLDVYLW